MLRNKWQHEIHNFEVGRLCLLRSELMPPCKWPFARITKVHLGDGGQVRVVTIRTATSSFHTARCKNYTVAHCNVNRGIMNGEINYIRVQVKLLIVLRCFPRVMRVIITPSVKAIP